MPKLRVGIVNFLNSNLPTTAQNFASLRDEAGLFLDKIVGIVTNNRGLDELPEIWESLQPLIDTARRILYETATNSAKFIRTLLDNRDPLITMLSTVLEIVNKINQAMLGIAGNAVRVVVAIGGTFSAIGAFFSGGGLPGFQGPSLPARTTPSGGGSWSLDSSGWRTRTLSSADKWARWPRRSGR